MEKYKIHIKCMEDILPGSGESVPGITDIDLLTDDCGLPYMHAKTFKGHLREQMELLLFNDHDHDEAWKKSYLDTLLGGDNIDAAETGKIKVSEVRMPEAVKAVVRSKIRRKDVRESGDELLADDSGVSRDEVLDSLTVIRRFTRINDEGVADDGSLRSARMAVAGITFETMLYAEGLTAADRKFLEKAIRAIQHIGTFKSKGKGTVRCSIVDEYVNDDNEAILTDEATQACEEALDVEKDSACKGESVCDATGENTVDNIRNYVSYTIKLEEPVKMGAEGNQANTEALNYLAGSALRGMAIAEYIRKKGLDNAGLDKDPRYAKTLFKDTYFYDAYPMHGEKILLPVPEIYFADKHMLRDFNKYEKDTKIHTCLFDAPEEGEQRAGLGKYCQFGSNVLELTGVKKDGRLHIAIDKNERKKSQMFRYEAIAEGQSFAGLIRCKDEATARQFADVLRGPVEAGSCDEKSSTKTVYIGGSRGSGYGRCVLEDVRCISYEEVEYKYSITKKAQDAGDGKKYLVVYALSNLLPIDRFGTVTGKIDEAALEGREGLGLEGVKLEKAYVSTMRATGFNNMWRAGQVQRTGVRAGSVFVYSYESTDGENGCIDDAKIKKLEIEGIGQRRQEGFGRVLINLDMEKNVIRKANKEEHPETKIGEIDEVSARELKLIENRINEKREAEQIDFAALACAQDSENLIDRGGFTLTQAARLYNLMHQLEDIADQAEAENKLKIFIDGLKTKTRKAYNTTKLMLPNADKYLVSKAYMLDERVVGDASDVDVYDAVAWGEDKSTDMMATKNTSAGDASDVRYTDNTVKIEPLLCGRTVYMMDLLQMVLNKEVFYGIPNYIYVNRQAEAPDEAVTNKDFRRKCNFIQQTMRYIMRRKGGRR